MRAGALGEGYRPDQPNTKTITFSSTTSTTATVTMALDADYKNVVLQKEVTLKDGQGSCRLENFVPGNTYYYKAVAGSEVLTAGALKATGQLRMIRVDDGWNVRDLGGWTGWNGHKIRYEKIYRGGSLGGNYNGTDNHISPESQRELRRLGVGAQLDLRHPYTEKSVYWYGSTPGAFSRFDGTNSISAFTDTDGEKWGTLDFLQMNTCWAQVNAFKSSAIVADLAFIIKELKAGKGVYFHCRSGADRTGIIGLLIEGLLGVDDNYSAKGGQLSALDYELTSLSLDEEKTASWNAGTLTSVSYSDRPVTEVANSSTYQYFPLVRNLSVSGYDLGDYQKKCYYYLNRYFYDNSVDYAGRVFINKSDLDWFVNYMLNTSDFVGPDWGVQDADNTLQKAIDIAKPLEYKH